MLIDSTGHVAGVFTEHRLQLTNAADIALNRHYLNEGGDTAARTPRTVGKRLRIDHAAAHRRTTIGSGCVIGQRVYIQGFAVSATMC